MNLDTESQSNINQALQALAADIIPHEEYITNMTQVARKILDHLKSKSRYKIGHVAFAGSSGKKTTIIGSDFDCVVFINHEEPIFDDVLNDLQDCLTMTEGYSIKDIRRTKYSVQFQSSGFEFDLLPAPNFTVSSQSSSDDDRINLQQQKTLDKIKENPGKYRYPYSTGVSEAAVRFITKQEGFVNEMVRLCKFWYKSVSVKSPPSGAKTLIELIAVYAANKEDSFEKNSYLRCFSTFLSLVRNFENLNIVFEDEYKKFPEHQVPDYIRNQRPIVLEPANPYNNLAKYWKKDSMDLILKDYASETTRRLERLYTLTNANRGILYIPMQDLFEPQPKQAQFSSLSFQNPKLIVSSISEVKNYPDMKVRNEKVLKMEGVEHDVKVFQNYLSILLHGYVANPNVVTSQEDLKNQAGVFIDKILGHSPRNWVSSTERHEDYDVTYTIPLRKFSVLVSWKHS